MQTLTILFEGLCCHVAPADGALGGVSRRTILQDLTEHQPKHFCYIEFFKTDYDPTANQVWKDLVTPDSYDRFNYKYLNVKVQNVRIELMNPIVSEPPLRVLQSFDEMVPKLTKVDPTFTAIDSSYLQQKIASRLVGAYIDLTAGILSAGPTEQFRTFFTPEIDWPRRHLAQWAQLEVEIEGVAPILKITNLQDDTAKLLVLKPGTNAITIGNQTDDDIHGVPPTSPEGHFGKFYDLAVRADYKPTPKAEDLGLGVGCTNSSWP